MLKQTAQAGGRARRNCAAALAALFASAASLSYAQPVDSIDEQIVHPEPKRYDFFASRQDGWFWLNDPTVVKRRKDRQAPAAAAAPPAAEQAGALKAHADLARAVDEALKIAYIDPSEENIKRYLALWQFTVRKASVFTDLAQQVMWKNPQFDATVADGVRPTNPLAMNVVDEQRRSERVEALRRIARDYGVWFFFDATCGVCRVFAPLLKSFETLYGFNVLAISADGSTLPQFPNTRVDNGVGKQLRVVEYPQTFLVNPTTRDVLHLGSGAMSAEELAERAMQILRYRDEEMQQRLTQLSSMPGKR